MTSSLQESEEVVEFNITTAYSNLGLTEVQYSVRRQCSDEKEKLTVVVGVVVVVVVVWWWQ
jgi:hypothetical protein